MRINIYHILQEIWNLKINDKKKIQEIRIRVDKPIVLKYQNEVTITSIIPEQNSVMEFFQLLCQDSVYAYEEERKRGYMTIYGGHRVGFTGEMVQVEKGIYFAKYICYMNIRIAHELKNICEEIYTYLLEDNMLANTLIVSAPGVGKTTLLRDLIRKTGERYNVGVIDERGEIAGAYKGVESLDCGTFTDVITGADKRSGIDILVRTFAPKVIALDEIGNRNDAQALFFASVCGCQVLATAHGNSWTDIALNQEINILLTEKRFQRILFLRRNQQMQVEADIYDQDGNVICGGKQLHAAS